MKGLEKYPGFVELFNDFNVEKHKKIDIERRVFSMVGKTVESFVKSVYMQHIDSKEENNKSKVIVLREGTSSIYRALSNNKNNKASSIYDEVMNAEWNYLTSIDKVNRMYEGSIDKDAQAFIANNDLGITDEEFAAAQKEYRSVLEKKSRIEGKIYLIFQKDIEAYIKSKYKTYMKRDADDLLQMGSVAFLKAINAYEIDKCTEPMAYFMNYVRHEVQDYLNQMHNHTTIHYETNAAKVRKAEADIIAAGKKVTDRLISEVSGVSLSTVIKVRSLAYVTSTLERNDGKDEEGDFLPGVIGDDSQISNPEKEYEKKRFVETVHDAIEDKLTEDEKTVILLMFGFVGPQMKVTEISQRMNKTINEIKNIQVNALRKLRDSNIKFYRSKESNSLWQNINSFSDNFESNPFAIIGDDSVDMIDLGE